jgi:hypothetical protein
LLYSSDALKALVVLLLEKEALRRSIRASHPRSRVMTLDEAGRLLLRIAEISEVTLGKKTEAGALPRVIITGKLNQLAGQTLKSYLFFLPIALIFLFMGLSWSFGDAASYLIVVASLLLLLIPLLLHRRTRIHLEHLCVYGRDEKDRPVIVMDHLPVTQFQSYLAHEYAHHLYTALWGEKGESWLREGWCRLLQWKIVQRLQGLEGRPEYLQHALDQIIGELKFACLQLSTALGEKLPLRVKTIRTIYQTNPLIALLTGTPLTNPATLKDHSIGTAFYFLAAKKWGPRTTLMKIPSEVSRLEGSGLLPR